MTRFRNIDTKQYPPEETGIIILGDFGANFYLNKTDKKVKRKLMDLGFHFYAVRGNHEQRPELIEGMEVVYDDEVKGMVYREPDFPKVNYLMDGAAYSFNGYTALVIGGAYSIDKWYRLNRAGCTEDMDPMYVATHAGWFKDEQLTKKEMARIEEDTTGFAPDFILSHTCPLSWEPTDLFLGGIDQSKVDKTMEQWLDHMKDKWNWGIWLFGHYHDDRLVRPGVEMFYRELDDLNDLWYRWQSDDPEELRVGWWLVRDPNYNAGN